MGLMTLPVYRHRNSCVDYTYHFNMQSFSVIDHFFVSEQLFQHCVLKQYVSHDVDNMSDHDALCLRLQLDISCFRLSDRVFTLDHHGLRPLMHISTHIKMHCVVV